MSSHLSGQNCPRCTKSGTRTTKDFLEFAIKKHGNRYDYSKSIYNSSNGKVIIICKIHGEFSQSARTHIVSNGCPKCGHKDRTAKRRENKQIKTSD